MKRLRRIALCSITSRVAGQAAPSVTIMVGDKEHGDSVGQSLEPEVGHGLVASRVGMDVVEVLGLVGGREVGIEIRWCNGDAIGGVGDQLIDDGVVLLDQNVPG